MNFKKKVKRKMLMVTIGAEDHASSRVRAIQYIPLLASKLNFEIKLIPRIPTKSNSKFSKYLLFPIKKRYFALKRAFCLVFKTWDVIFIQKIFLPNWILKQIKKRNPIIIFDFDDAIYLEQKRQKLNEQKTVRMLNTASKIIVSAEELVTFCAKQNITPTIITSSVDTERIKPLVQKQKELITIGWIGSHSTTKFITDIQKPLLQISKKFKVRILIVGAEQGYTLNGINIVTKKWSLEKEAELINEMDIGIMPLPKTEYAKAKGGYKLFLYMAAGVPVVASAIGINKNIVQNGENGFLAEHNEDWIEYLTKLITKKELREKMGQAGRDTIEEKYSLNVCFKKLTSVLET